MRREVDLALRMPTALRRGKSMLRRAFADRVPASILKRRKMGFGVPIARWLCGPLRAWAESLLGEDRLRREGFLDPIAVRRRWSAYLAGMRDWHSSLWNILMWQAWLEEAGRHG